MWLMDRLPIIRKKKTRKKSVKEIKGEIVIKSLPYI